MHIYRGPSAVPSSGRRARLGSPFAGPALHPSAYLQGKERAVANWFLRVEIAERRSTGSLMVSAALQDLAQGTHVHVTVRLASAAGTRHDVERGRRRAHRPGANVKGAQIPSRRETVLVNHSAKSIATQDSNAGPVRMC